MDRIFLDLGIVQISWYSLFMFLGILVGGILILRESKKFNISEDFIINLIFWAVIFGIVGARAYYVAFNWDYYLSNPLEIIQIWKGGLAIHGGILLVLIFTIFYTKKYKGNLFRVTDISIVGLIIGQAIGRWGNFFNQEAYGSAVTRSFLENLHLPNFIIDGMNIYGTYYHPTFLYESLWCFLGFIALLIIRRQKYLKIGQLTGIYFMWYGLGRFFIEILRTDSLMLGSLKMAQLVSIALFIAGLAVVAIRGRGSRFENLYGEEETKNEIKF